MGLSHIHGSSRIKIRDDPRYLRHHQCRHREGIRRDPWRTGMAGEKIKPAQFFIPEYTDEKLGGCILKIKTTFSDVDKKNFSRMLLLFTQMNAQVPFTGRKKQQQSA